MKKVTALVLIFILAISSIASAAPKLNEKQIDKRLLEIGVPQELIDGMPLDYKIDVAENAIEFLGSEKTTLSESLDEGTIQPLGTIPSDQMDFYIDIYATDNSPDGRERFMLYARFDWNEMPFWRLEDVVALSWDRANWRAVDDSWKWSTSWTAQGQPVVTESGYECSEVTADGIYFHIDIIGGSLTGLTQWGYGKVTIESKTTGPISGSDQVYAKYVHNKSTSTIGIIYSGVSIGVTGTSTYDERGTSKIFSY